MKGKIIAKALLSGVIIAAIIVGVVILVIILNGAERRIPVQYSKKDAGQKNDGRTVQPYSFKVNTAGVIPVIFASSIMSFPSVIASFLGKTGGTGIGGKILAGMNSNNWFDLEHPWYSIGLVAYIVMVIFFAYFYTSITFNPLEVADNMKSRVVLSGIRPGKPTVDYLTKMLNYIIFIGAAGLTIVLLSHSSLMVYSGCECVLRRNYHYCWRCILETIKQIESMMLVRNYKGFLNN